MNILAGLSAAKIEHNIQERTLKPGATPSSTTKFILYTKATANYVGYYNN